MTPFGARVRALRKAKGVTLKQMAGALRLSSAYLSALGFAIVLLNFVPISYFFTSSHSF